MNRTLKYALMFAGAAFGTYGLIRILKNRNQDAYEPSPQGGSGSGTGLTLDKISKSINRNLVLKLGSRGEEVRLLQKILGVPADGIFGSGETLPALKSMAGVDQTTLSTIDGQIAAMRMKVAQQQAASAIRTNFPVGKSVTAAATIRVYANLFRNGDWFSTDADGKPMPSKEFLKTADLGKVFDYSKTYPDVVILKMTNPVGGYQYAGVRASWIK